MADGIRTAARPALRAMVVACAAAAALAPACKGGRSAAKGAASGPGGARAHVLVESGSPDRDCIYDVILAETDDSALADAAYANIGAKFQPPSVLVSVPDKQTATALLDAFREAGCEVGMASVVSGRIEWRIEVVEQGSGTNCMVDTLKGLFPGTNEADWKSRVGVGKVVSTSTDPAEADVTRISLEKKCGCKVRKTYKVN